MAAVMANEDKVILGKVGAPYGIKGWLKLTPYTDDPQGIFNYQSLFIQTNGQWQQHQVSDWRRHNNGIVFKLAEINDRNEAQAVVNGEIAVLETELPNLANDEFYWRELIGLQVCNKTGYDMGRVIDLLETGSNDVLVIQAKANDAYGKQQRLIPFMLGQAVLDVDRSQQVITVDWDPGF